MNAGNKQGIESPDPTEGLAKIHETQKAREKGMAAELPATTYTTSVEGDEIEAGILKNESEVKQNGEEGSRKK